MSNPEWQRSSEQPAPLAIEGRTDAAFARKRLRSLAMIERILAGVDITLLNWQGTGVQLAYVPSDYENERLVLMRNEEHPDGSVMTYTSAEWEAFLAGAREGEFDDMVG